MSTVRILGEDFSQNARGVIDATDRYHSSSYMSDGPGAWELAPLVEVEARIVHHFAGDFIRGRELTMADELAEIDAAARYHASQFGIGPAYNMIVGRLGNVYAVGKHGTRRAHTKGRSPETRRPWNDVGRAVALIGNFETEQLAFPQAEGLRLALDEMASWPAVDLAPICLHGTIPTVNSAGVSYSQSTLCPGANVHTWLAMMGEQDPPVAPDPDAALPDFERGILFGFTDGWGEGYTAGWEAGHASLARVVGAASAAVGTIPEPPTR